MTYSVDLYENTGFNQNNIPDSPVRLGQPFMTKTAIDVIQNRVISSINIKVNSFDEIKNVDYCKLGDFYYIVGDVNMKAHDVATLSLIPDFISSAGGIDNIDFLDGITSRHHVSDDTFGKYTEEDPLLICKRPLKVDFAPKLFTGDESEDFLRTVIMSTVDLSEMGASEELPAITYSDTNGNSVTVPSLIPVTEDTVFSIENTGKPFTIKGQRAYDPIDREAVIRGIQYCRDINAESGIIAQYVIPVQNADVRDDENGSVATIKGTVLVEEVQNLPLIFNEDVKNNRVMYGGLCTYGLLTSNGNKAEYRPERILDGDNLLLNVVMVSDPRPEGKPYFRFEVIDGSRGITEAETTEPGRQQYKVLDRFWVGAIPGENWYQLPLVFTSAAGSEIAEKYYNQQYSLNDYMYRKNDTVQATNLLTSQIANMGQFISGAFGDVNITKPKVQSLTPVTDFFTGGGYTFNEGMNFNQGYNTAAAGVNAIMNPITYGVQRNMREQQYNYNVGKNLYELGLSQTVVVPEVTTPYSKGTIRDFFTNGVLVYRYRPEDTDLAIQDKILTMYGYKVTEPLKKEFFNNREYFNYIELNSASIGGDLPQWFKGGILQQLGNGVRIWHTKPNESYYNNNPIKE